MKTFFFGAMALAGLTSVTTFAGTPFATCANGDSVTQVSIEQVAQGVFEAKVTVESFGGSYPTFDFKNIEQESRPVGIVGAPTVYRGNGFELTIQFDALERPAVLDVPSIGIHNETMDCN